MKIKYGVSGGALVLDEGMNALTRVKLKAGERELLKWFKIGWPLSSHLHSTVLTCL
jgi:hypothetical protein